MKKSLLMVGVVAVLLVALSGCSGKDDTTGPKCSADSQFLSM